MPVRAGLDCPCHVGEQLGVDVGIRFQIQRLDLECAVAAMRFRIEAADQAAAVQYRQHEITVARLGCGV